MSPSIDAWPLTWGAIAYSKATRRWYGSYHLPEEDMARTVALNGLGENDGEILIAGNATCLSLAISDNGAYCAASGRVGSPPEEAERLALECCKNYGGVNCKVELTFYTSNGRRYR